MESVLFRCASTGHLNTLKLHILQLPQGLGAANRYFHFVRLETFLDATFSRLDTCAKTLDIWLTIGSKRLDFLFHVGRHGKRGYAGKGQGRQDECTVDHIVSLIDIKITLWMANPAIGMTGDA